MFSFTFIAIALLVPALWVWNMLSLWNWRYFILFFPLNAVIVAAYIYGALTGAIGFSGHDEYGLGRIVFALEVLLTHVILIALFIIVFKRAQSHTGKRLVF